MADNNKGLKNLWRAFWALAVLMLLIWLFHLIGHKNEFSRASYSQPQQHVHKKRLLKAKSASSMPMVIPCEEAVDMQGEIVPPPAVEQQLPYQQPQQPQVVYVTPSVFTYYQPPMWSWAGGRHHIGAPSGYRNHREHYHR